MKRHWLGGAAALLFCGTVGAAMVAQEGAKKEEAPKKEEPAVGTQPGNKIGPLTVKLHSTKDGKSSDLELQKVGKPLVMITIQTRCGATPGYIGRYKELEKVYAQKGVQVVFLYPNSSKIEPDEEKIAFHKEKGFVSPLSVDPESKIGKALGCKNSAEAFVIDKNGLIQYRGGIDDNSRDASAVKNKYLANAIDAVLAGKKVEVSTAKAFG